MTTSANIPTKKMCPFWILSYAEPHCPEWTRPSELLWPPFLSLATPPCLWPLVMKHLSAVYIWFRPQYFASLYVYLGFHHSNREMALAKLLFSSFTFISLLAFSSVSSFSLLQLSYGFNFACWPVLYWNTNFSVELGPATSIQGALWFFFHSWVP